MFWHALSLVGLGVIDVFAGIADKGLPLHPMLFLLIKKDPISQTGAVNRCKPGEFERGTGAFSCPSAHAQGGTRTDSLSPARK